MSQIVDLLSEKLDGQIFPIRTSWESKDELALMLDRNSAIDALLRDQYGDLAGISLRVLEQHDPEKQFDTITIRSKTSKHRQLEFPKLKRLISKSGYLRPVWTAHAVVRGQTLILALARTEDLVRWMLKNSLLVSQRTNPVDGNTFFAVSWDDLQGQDWFRLFHTQLEDGKRDKELHETASQN